MKGRPEPHAKVWYTEAEATLRVREIFPCPGGPSYSAELRGRPRGVSVAAR